MAQSNTIDKFLNSYLRTLSEEEKKDLLGILGDVATDPNAALYTLFDGDNEDAIARLSAYAVKYSQQNPDFLNQLGSYLGQYYNLALIGAAIVTVVELIASVPILSHAAESLVETYLLSQGITIPEIRAFLEKIYSNLDDIEITDSGDDKKPQSTGEIGSASFVVNVSALNHTQDHFTSVSSLLNEKGDAIKTIAGSLPTFMFITRGKAKSQADNVIKLAEKCSKFSEVIQEIAEIYQRTETNCAVVE